MGELETIPKILLVLLPVLFCDVMRCCKKSWEFNGTAVFNVEEHGKLAVYALANPFMCVINFSST